MGVIGCSVMAYFSKPVQFIQWFCFGISRWYYAYWCQFTKFKTEQAVIEENEDESVGALDDVLMNDDNPLFAKKKKTHVMIYLYTVLDKMKIFYALAVDFIFGIVAFIKPIFESKKIENETFAATNRRVIRNSDGVIIGYSDDSPQKKSPKRKTPKSQKGSKNSPKSKRLSSMFHKDDAKKITKQPTFCRQTSLRQIESDADKKIDSMLSKLNA